MVPLAGWFFGKQFVLGYSFTLPPPHPPYPCVALSPILNINSTKPTIFTTLILAYLDLNATSVRNELVRLYSSACSARINDMSDGLPLARDLKFSGPSSEGTRATSREEAQAEGHSNETSPESATDEAEVSFRRVVVIPDPLRTVIDAVLRRR